LCGSTTCDPSTKELGLDVLLRFASRQNEGFASLAKEDALFLGYKKRF